MFCLSYSPGDEQIHREPRRARTGEVCGCLRTVG